MRVPVNASNRFEMTEVFLGGPNRKQVLPNRIPRRSVAERNSTIYGKLRQTAQKRLHPFVEVSCRPNRRRRSHRIKINDRDLPERRGFVVAFDNRQLRKRTQTLYHLIGLRAVSHAVAQHPYRRITATRPRISKHGFQRRQVAVDVRKQQYWSHLIDESHGSEPTVRPNIIGHMQSDERSAQAPISESDLVEIIKQRLNGGKSIPDGEIGVGDDAAVLKFDADYIVLTADAMVDGVHFLSQSMSWHDIGWKCIVSNQSDIAAMGALPEHAVLTLAIPTTTRVGDLDEVLSGVIDALDTYGGRLVGGDTVASEKIILSVSMTGRLVDPDRPLTRDSARPGQLIAVTGPLGNSAGGLKVLSEGSKARESSFLLESHFRPGPRVDLAEALVGSGVQCAMDISDGLLIDLERICIASGVNAVIHAEKVPVEPELLAIFPKNARKLALTGGEDYELLYIADPSQIAKVNATQPVALPADYGVIGEIEPSDNGIGNVTVLDDVGNHIEFGAKGWDHFAT